MTALARHLTISGKVQGVWFRDWTVQTATGLGLTGWVRNRADGSVETVVQGDKTSVERFIELAHEGSPAARVDTVAVKAFECAELPGFAKRPTA